MAKLTANANVSFSKKTLQHFTKLVELTKQPTQESAERFLIDHEMELSVVADQYDIEGVETVDYKDVKWKSSGLQN
ncbi:MULTISPECIES: hypothetical protein [Wolbachia]|uniref:hypothetical protein n=1 Tax=Wolbachia TaxID=953 RepID=UPI001BAE4E39|nr:MULTISPECIES: hypothetical protein [unclassified Wolbachia]QUI60481.1 hypothetical protein JKF54_00420 [Wolbachia endosymbiont of Spodoptera picta]URG40356.1 hypothetical protein M1L25_000425 [Wolbachia endosymbiont of Ostrinia furnacalis]URG40632.1 hypothetical protein M1L26_000717 [Wolbachia endosymbiont of Ostrinia scapulalis]